MPAVSRFSPPPPGNLPPPEHSSAHQHPRYVPGGPGYARGFYPIELRRAISLAFSMYRFAWRTFAAISLITGVPTALATAWAAAATYEPMLAWQRAVRLGGVSDGPPPDFSTFPWQTILVPLLVTFVVGPLAVIGGAALVDAIATTLRGGRPGVRNSYSAAFARLRDLLLVFLVLIATGLSLSLFSLLFPLIGALGRGGIGLSGPSLFAALIVGVAVLFAVAFVTIRLVFTIQTLMLEQKPAGPALRRSWEVTAGSMLRVVGWAIAFGFLVGLLGLGLEIIAGVVAFIVAPPHFTNFTFEQATGFLFTFSFLTAALSAIVAPIVTIGLTLLYLDIRWRRGEPVLTPGTQPVDPTQPAAG